MTKSLLTASLVVCLFGAAGCASIANKDDIYLLKSEVNEDLTAMETQVQRLEEQVQELTQTIDFLEKDTTNQVLNISNEISERLSLLETTINDDKEVMAKKINLLLNEISSQALVSRPTRRIPPPGSTTYMVRTGDTVTKIARKFEITQEELMLVNGIENENYLAIGEVLVIPSE